MNIFVTGGAGYIGSIVCAQLAAAGHHVTVLDNLSNGHEQAIPPGARFVRGDIGDAALLSTLFREGRFDAVMHFAAFIEASESMRHPARFFRNNSANALTLLETLLAHDVRRIVFSSTAALYGNPQRTPIGEDDPLVPVNAYGESKLLVERMLEWFHRIHGLSYASLRYFNAAGATEELGEAHDPETHVIPMVLRVAAGKRESIAIFGTDYDTPDGTCVRDYIHVTDLASAHLLALNKLGSSNDPEKLIFNLGNGVGFSVRQVIETARRVTGHAIPVVESPRRAGDPAILVASSEKIRKELGWRPQYPDLESIVSSAWGWMTRNPGGYR